MRKANRDPETLLRHSSWLRALALRLARDEASAEDALQETWLAALRRPPATLSGGWLARVLRRRISDRRRGDASRRAREIRVAREERITSTPDEALMTVEFQRRLATLVLELDEPLRSTVIRRYFHDETPKRIAREDGVAVTTVRTRLAKALEQLRRRLDRTYGGRAAWCVLVAGLRMDSPATASAAPDAGGAGVAASGVARLSTAALLTGLGGSIVAKKLLISTCVLAVLLVSGTLVVLHRPRPKSPLQPDAIGSRAPPAGSATMTDEGGPPGDGARPAAVATDVASQVKSVASAAPLASLAGVVWDDEGALLTGARVFFIQEIDQESATRLREDGYEVEPGELRRETETNQAGEYLLTDLLPHRGQLGAEHGDLFQCNFAGYRPRLEPGEDARQNVTLCHRYRLEGTITGTDGAAVPGAEVAIHYQAAWHLGDYEDHSPRRFPAGARGRYDTGNAIVVQRQNSTDPLEVIAYAPGYSAVYRQVDGVEFEAYSAQMDFTLERELSVVVRVLDAHRRPVEGALVEPATGPTSRIRGVPGARGTTGADGRVRLEHLRKERERLRIEKEGLRDAVLWIEPGQPEERLVVLEAFGPAIAGRVVFDEGYPQKPRGPGDRVRVQLEREDDQGRFLNQWGVSREIEKESLGYRFWPDEPGRYRVRWEDGLVVWRTEPFVFDGGSEVRADIRVRLQAPYAKGIVVRPGTDEPVGGVEVAARFVPTGGETRSTWSLGRRLNDFCFPLPPGNATGIETDAEGRFLLVLPRERFDLWNPSHRTVMLRAGSREDGWSNDVTFDFEDDTVIEDIRLELFSGGSIEGQVRFPDGAPSAQELVAAYDGKGVVHWTLADAEGHFRIDRLRPGQYALFPLGPCAAPRLGGGGGGAASEGLPPPHEFFDLDVLVRDGETTQRDIDLGRDGLGAIEGSLVDAPATPGVTSFAISYGMLVGGMPRSFAPLGGDTALANGRFAADNLLPGRYRIYARGRAGGNFTAEAEVDVRSGAVSSVRLAPPTGALVVPIRGAGEDALDEVDVYEVARVVSAPGVEREVVERWGGYGVSRVGEAIRIAPVPPGLVRVGLVVPGFCEAKTEPVMVAIGAEALAAPLNSLTGRSIRVRIDAPNVEALPETIGFRVPQPGDRAGWLHHYARRVESEPVWVLSAFPPGTYEIRVDAGSGFRTARETVTLGGSEDAEITVRLERED